MTHAADPLPPAIPPLVEPAELPNWVLLNDERLLVIDKVDHVLHKRHGQHKGKRNHPHAIEFDGVELPKAI